MNAASVGSYGLVTILALEMIETSVVVSAPRAGMLAHEWLHLLPLSVSWVNSGNLHEDARRWSVRRVSHEHSCPTVLEAGSLQKTDSGESSDGRKSLAQLTLSVLVAEDAAVV